MEKEPKLFLQVTILFSIVMFTDVRSYKLGHGLSGGFITGPYDKRKTNFLDLQ